MDDKIYLKWNSYSTTLLNSLQKFQNKEQFCDSTIVCKGNFYPVHRLLLSLCSKYFESIYEKISCKHPFLIISDIEPIHLEALLDFVYHGEVEISNNLLPHFLKAAEALMIKGLTHDETMRSSKSDWVKYPTNKSKQIKRSPIILDPILPLQKLDDSIINSNEASHLPLLGTLMEKKFKTSEKIGKQKKKTYFLQKKLSRIAANANSIDCEYSLVKLSNAVESNTNSYPNSRIGDKEFIHNNKKTVSSTIITEYDETTHASKDYNNFQGNFVHNGQTSPIIINSCTGAHIEEFEATHNVSEDEIDENNEVKVEFPEFSADDDDYFGYCQPITVKSEINSYDEYSNPLGLGLANSATSTTDSEVVENSIQDELSPSQLFEFDTEVRNSDSKSDCFDEREMFFSSIDLKESIPVTSIDSEILSGGQLQNQAENRNLSKNVELKCKFCPYVSTKRSVRCHESAHASGISLKCKFCWYRSILRCNIIRHQEYCYKGKFEKSLMIEKKFEQKDNEKTIKASIESKPTEYKCHCCSYSSKHQGHLRLHQRAHTGDKMKCKFCSFTSFFKSVMTKHELKEHEKTGLIANGNRIFKCCECPFTSGYKNAVDKHKACHSSNKLYKCKTCSYSAKKRGFLLRHEKLHNASKTEFPPKNSLQMGTIKSASATKIKKHRKNLYNCKKCSYIAENLIQLNNHKLEHLVNKTKKLKIAVDKETSHQSDVTASKTYKCNFCPYTSNFKWGIIQHEINHKSNRRFKCSKCTFSSNYNGHVTNHKKLHNSFKIRKSQLQDDPNHPYSPDKRNKQALADTFSKNNLACEYCSYVSPSIGYYKQHMMIHTGEKPYTCYKPNCKYRTHFKSNLFKHQSTCQAC